MWLNLCAEIIVAKVTIRRILSYMRFLYRFIYTEGMEVSTFMQEINNTQYFKVQKEQEIEVKDVIARIYEALKEKGYNPVNQIVGYVMSGDPTYITSHNGARSLIRRVERDEIIELLLEDYIKNNFER